MVTFKGYNIADLNNNKKMPKLVRMHFIETKLREEGTSKAQIIDMYERNEITRSGIVLLTGLSNTNTSFLIRNSTPYRQQVQPKGKKKGIINPGINKKANSKIEKLLDTPLPKGGTIRDLPTKSEYNAARYARLVRISILNRAAAVVLVTSIAWTIGAVLGYN